MSISEPEGWNFSDKNKLHTSNLDSSSSDDSSDDEQLFSKTKINSFLFQNNKISNKIIHFVIIFIQILCNFALA